MHAYEKQALDCLKNVQPVEAYDKELKKYVSMLNSLNSSQPEYHNIAVQLCISVLSNLKVIALAFKTQNSTIEESLLRAQKRVHAIKIITGEIISSEFFELAIEYLF